MTIGHSYHSPKLFVATTICRVSASSQPMYELVNLLKEELESHSLK
jgi:hypothetical protein